MLQQRFLSSAIMALMVALTLVASACSFSDELEPATMTTGEYQKLKAVHGSSSVGRVYHLFDEALEDDEKTALATSSSKKVHVQRLHKVTVYEFPVGRREPGQDADGRELSTIDQIPYHRGWVAELGSVRRGLIETVFYSNDWSEMASLSPEGYLSIGNGRSKVTLPRKMSASLASELVYRAPSRYGIRQWEEDVALIGRFSNSADLASANGVRSERPETRVVKNDRRVVMTGYDASNFGLLISQN